MKDAREKLAQKDAREKLAQKDARFRIRARGGSAGAAVQDARQTINSRKHQLTPAIASVPPSPAKPVVPHIHIHNTGPRGGVALQPGGGITRVVDARDRLSLKRSVPSTSNQLAAALKITKTIQVSQSQARLTSMVFCNKMCVCVYIYIKFITKRPKQCTRVE